VICHHGSAGGGHYTAHALNPIDEEWYEFDDSTVTKMEPGAVMSSEAYVLFYRKNGSSNESARERMQALLTQNIEAPRDGIHQYFYIFSIFFLNRF
jgi:ubiquitin carboxyl-terminal hydrolase 20/33